MGSHTPIPDAELDEMEEFNFRSPTILRLIAEVRALRKVLHGIAYHPEEIISMSQERRLTSVWQEAARAVLPAPGERKE